MGRGRSGLISTVVNGQQVTYALTGNDTEYTGNTFTTTLTNTATVTELYTTVTVTKSVDDSGTGNTDASGFAFYLTGTSAAGNTVDMYAVTDSGGRAIFSQVPYSSGNYTVTEVSYAVVNSAASSGNSSASAILYSVTKDLANYTSVWSTTLTVNSTAAKSISASNTIKSWYITVTKMDSVLQAYGSAQEGYSLSGAVYGLYKADGTKVAEYTTDANGQFTTGYYECCEGWYIQEISAPVGYTLDTTKYIISASNSTITAAKQATYFANTSTVSTYKNVVFETPELVSAAVTKTWDDNNDEMGVRPSKLTVYLYRSSTNVAEQFVSEVEINGTGNTWSTSVSGLVKYDSKGAEYTYYWKEETLPASYNFTVDGLSYTVDGYDLAESTAWNSATKTWNTSLTNSITVMIPVTVTKIWNDDSNAQKIRPEEIYVLLYSTAGWVDVNGDAVTSSTAVNTAFALNSGNNWTAQAVVPKYNSSGTELGYNFMEIIGTGNITAAASGTSYSLNYIRAGGAKKYLSNLDVSWHTGDLLTGYVVDYEYAVLSTGTKDTQTTITNEHTPNKDITLTEIIPADDFGYYFDDYGDYPSFTFELKDENGTVLATQVIEFTQDYVAANTDGDGNVSISVAFEHLTYGTYTITKTVQAEEWEIVSVDAENGTVKQTVVTEFEINSSNVSEDSNIVLAAAYADSYEPKAEIAVTKKIDTKSLEQYGLDSEFVFTLERSDGTTYIKTAVIAASTDPSTADKDGYVSVTVTFSDLEYGYTYVLEESEMPERWTFVSVSTTGGTITDEDKVTFGPFTKANAKDTYAAVYVDEYILGTITIIKYGNGNDLLNGVEYTLYYSDGTVAATGTTGEDGDGALVFEDLIKDTYILTETSTLDGYTLLADEIIAEIPLELTDAEYEQYKAAGINIDVSTASHLRGVYSFSDLTYEITDTANLALPTTGDTGRTRKVLLAIFAGLILTAAVAVGVSLKREHGQAVEKDPDSPDTGNIPEADSPEGRSKTVEDFTTENAVEMPGGFPD